MCFFGAFEHRKVQIFQTVVFGRALICRDSIHKHNRVILSIMRESHCIMFLHSQHDHDCLSFFCAKVIRIKNVKQEICHETLDVHTFIKKVTSLYLNIRKFIHKIAH